MQFVKSKIANLSFLYMWQIKKPQPAFFLSYTTNGYLFCRIISNPKTAVADAAESAAPKSLP
jgi:hypothetical protein